MDSLDWDWVWPSRPDLLLGRMDEEWVKRCPSHLGNCAVFKYDGEQCFGRFHWVGIKRLLSSPPLPFLAFSLLFLNFSLCVRDFDVPSIFLLCFSLRSNSGRNPWFIEISPPTLSWREKLPPSASLHTVRGESSVQSKIIQYLMKPPNCFLLLVVVTNLITTWNFSRVSLKRLRCLTCDFILFPPFLLSVCPDFFKIYHPVTSFLFLQQCYHLILI